jgi:hypothetical protein
MPVRDMDYESVLRATIAEAADERCPRTLAAALTHAVFPGGARVRPKLCLAVALANDCDAPALAAAAAASVELLHCASLVHDDLPCFDNAAERRGVPSVHALFGEPIACSTGDALIVAAFASPGAAGLPVPCIACRRCCAWWPRGSAPLRVSPRARPGSPSPWLTSPCTTAPRPAPCSSPPRRRVLPRPESTRSPGVRSAKDRRGLPGCRRHQGCDGNAGGARQALWR